MSVAFDHVFMVVSDLERSKRFYELLGFSAEVWDGGYVRLVGSDGSYVGMEQRPAGDVVPGGLELVIRVDDVHDLHRELVAAGVTFDGQPQPQEWGATHAWLRDPDGYRLSIFTPAGDA